MSAADDFPHLNSEQSDNRGLWLTSRVVVVREVAVGWLGECPVGVTVSDLSKTLQQLVTELFGTRVRCRGEGLSSAAVAVLVAAGVDPVEFGPVRSFGVSADMPVSLGVLVARVARVLAPLAAAVQLARSPIADAARDVLVGRGGVVVPRRELRGFVVARLRPHAVAIQARVGVGGSVERYVELILADRDVLAQAVVEAACGKQGQARELDAGAAARLGRCYREHHRRLQGVAGMYGVDAQWVLSDTWVKLAEAFRMHPDLEVDFKYLRVALKNAAASHFAGVAVRSRREVAAVAWGEESAVGGCDVVPGEVADQIVRHVLATAAVLRGGVGVEPGLAAETVVRYFLVDPAVRDPRRARLAAAAVAAGVDTAEYLGTQLHTVAATLTPDRHTADRITTLALNALTRR